MNASSPALPLREIADGVFVAPQLRPEDMAVAARLGIRSIINNRPDAEGGPDQPTDATMSAAAEAAGLSYRFLPVASSHQTPEQVVAFATLMVELPHPVLAFCRSGTRSARLWSLAQAM